MSISKEKLADATPDNAKINDGAILVLRRWLSDRYARSSFSNAFNDLLSKKEIEKKLTKMVKPYASAIEVIYFDVDDEIDLIQKDGDPPYELSIFLQYSPEQDADSLAIVTAAAKQIKELFKDGFWNDPKKRWQEIHLIDCYPIADTAMDMATYKKLRRFDVEHLSLRATPHQTVVGH